MSVCPHCQRNCINPFKGFWSDSACPVRCPSCNGLAYLHRRETSGLNAIWNVGFIAIIPAIVLANSVVIPLAIWALWLLVVLGLVLWKSPLSAISESQAAENKRYGNIVLGLVVVAGTIWWFLAHA